MQGINLGKCWNKYIIIEIFLLAGEEDPQREAEIVLWACSRRHRTFLSKNFDWYPSKFLLPCVISLKEQSALLETYEQGRFLFEHIRIDGVKQVTEVTRIFTASIDGWEASDFHHCCNGNGPTLSLIRSIHNYLSAGFTSISW